MEQVDSVSVVYVPWWTSGEIAKERAKIKKNGKVKLIDKDTEIYKTDFILGRSAFLTEEEARKSCEEDRINWIAILKRKISEYESLSFHVVDNAP